MHCFYVSFLLDAGSTPSGHSGQGDSLRIYVAVVEHRDCRLKCVSACGFHFACMNDGVQIVVVVQDALQELALMGYIGSDSSNNGVNGRINGKFNFTKGTRPLVLPDAVVRRGSAGSYAASDRSWDRACVAHL